MRPFPREVAAGIELRIQGEMAHVVSRDAWHLHWVLVVQIYLLNGFVRSLQTAPNDTTSFWRFAGSQKELPR
ncbi:hypothetical protein LIER_08589 [Lithospermum erythrorhizon]|uniref:Uncharacterized protein n=1 Tax=Lithospermum erythrorhizon TaxID=34254 RepID=A0AAV3PDW5_LITER